MRLVRRRPLEVYVSTLCVAHLALLLLLLALLPSDALPPAHLLGSERPQQFAGLLALAALVVFAATDALLIYWHQRRNRPLKPLQAWAVWWAFVVTIIALVDSLLIRSYGLLISTAFAGPILLAVLYGHRAWADDAYRFVESWQQVEAAWHGTDAAIAHAATIVTAEVVVDEAPQVVEAALPAGGVGSSAAGPSSSDVSDGEPAPPTRQSSAGRRALARARDSRDKSSSRDNAASLTGPGTGLAEHGAGEAPTSTRCRAHHHRLRRLQTARALLVKPLKRCQLTTALPTSAECAKRSSRLPSECVPLRCCSGCSARQCFC